MKIQCTRILSLRRKMWIIKVGALELLLIQTSIACVSRKKSQKNFSVKLLFQKGSEVGGNNFQNCKKNHKVITCINTSVSSNKKCEVVVNGCMKVLKIGNAKV